MSNSEPRLNFIIVGASIAGLASAIALKRSRHNVLVLEKETILGGTSVPPGCARVPPNGSKILFDWGLRAQTKGSAYTSLAFAVYKSPDLDFMGLNTWDPELLSEARGDFCDIKHQDLLRILYEEATKPSTQENLVPHVAVLFGAEVVKVDCDNCSVTLLSGEIHTGDAIIGADGAYGPVRRMLIEAENVDPRSCDTPTGMTLYSAKIPRAAAIDHPQLALFYEYPKCTVEMGSNRGAFTASVGIENDIGLWVYTPDSTEDGCWTRVAGRKLVDILDAWDPQIKMLASLAGPATCVQIKDHHELESWVSRNGRVIVVGEAAHPFPPAALHTYSVALEDGAFIGKVFSHTRDRVRIPEFFNAFEEHRRPRCMQIREIEKRYIELITLPDGGRQKARDEAMRANHAAGRNVMEVPGSDLQQMVDATRMIFAYDPSDDADEWWMSWGRLRDSAKAATE
ncbi:hypothetical protein B0H15DRAFT_816225 [Mycena belliarum]|uniref:FAD-binding domain-containing protein n=1 Tax=Mycena belliarum TaxID=1033014 RepID=A0AAD6UFE4_9AGAR|nr:hypothetical protein B0H15DRAFT_816225 [Mycena belliae]